MADWTDITNAALDGDSPVTPALIESLRDNPIAITEGATGAPQVQTAAIADGAITNDKIADGTISPDKLYPAVVGDLVDGASLGIVSTSSTTYVKMKELEIVRSGNYRITFNISSNVARTAGKYGRIYKNGVAIGTERQTDNLIFESFTEDINGWVTGDLCQLYLKCGTGTVASNLLATKASFVYGANATM